MKHPKRFKLGSNIQNVTSSDPPDSFEWSIVDYGRLQEVIIDYLPLGIHQSGSPVVRAARQLIDALNNDWELRNK